MPDDTTNAAGGAPMPTPVDPVGGTDASNPAPAPGGAGGDGGAGAGTPGAPGGAGGDGGMNPTPAEPPTPGAM